MKRIFNFFGFRSHDCKEVISKVQILIDGELDEVSSEQIIREINRCPACLEHYNIDKAYKEFLQVRIGRKCCAEQLKSRILGRIRDMDGEPQ